MTWRLRAAALLLGGALLPLPALAADACPALPPRIPLPAAATPAPLDNPLWHDFVAQADRAAALEPGRAQIVLLGDSITATWDPAVLARHFGRWRVMNLGVPGDYTHGMLWRLQRQWGPALKPRLAVLLIGTNNAGVTPPADTALGIAEVIRLIRARSPGTRVLLLALLPRGEALADPQRLANGQVNRLVAGCADGRQVVFLDAAAAMTGPDGLLLPGLFTDGLHPSPQGFAALAAAIAPTVERMMR